MASTYQMALWLAHSRVVGSLDFEPYVASLPERADSVLFWSDKDLAHLKGTSLVSNASQTRQLLQDDFDAILDALSEDEELTEMYSGFFSNLSLASFFDAVSIVTSRSFIGKVDDREVPFLVPVADLLNHAADPVLTLRFAEAGADVEEPMLEFVATRDIRRGSTLTVSYGPFANTALLLRYGFAVEANPHDGYVMQLVLGEDDPLRSVKSALLEAHGLPGDDTTFVLRRDTLPLDMLRALRVHYAKPSELDLISQVAEGKVLSLDNEVQVCRSVLAAIQSLLADFDTSIAEDQEALEEAADNHERYALMLRVGEKQILSSVGIEIQRHWLSLLAGEAPVAAQEAVVNTQELNAGEAF
eukprot:gnl/Ergobibamus_cyprinoides/604.p1 GENE.gnl/Ergobibamus_cyprinoides/604~~gnl/Ergobibamus_cyprinoides/604.p1  ORF type:complete len:358 (+),score=143.38 gnl/Ergobibamus_cyprinoides/604:190-1263(+)